MVLPSLTGLMSDTTDGGAAPGRITGITFAQVDYVSGGVKYTDTDTGRLEVNMEVLKRTTGLDSGYINGHTSAGWVIKDLPFFEYSPYERKVAYFNLSSTGDVRTLGIHLEVSQDIKARFTTGTIVSYPVFDTLFHIAGNSNEHGTANLKAPGPTPLKFNPAGWTEVYRQYNHHPTQNVQTAVNQCVPAGLANNFQYLEDTFGIDIEHDHVMGIGFRGNGTVVPENSLVGTLDVYTRRNVTDRLTGGGVSVNGMLNATLDYLDDYDLPLTSRHQGEFGDECYYHDSSDVTSMGEGGTIDWAWVMGEVKYGHGVTLRFWRYDNGEHAGGHQIETTGAGFIGGVPYLEFCHDEAQSDDFTGLVAEATYLDFNESFDHWMMVDDPYPSDKDGPSHVVHALSLEAQNQAPSTPVFVSGDRTPESGTPSVYGFVSEDPEDHLLYYKVDWGDGEYSDWLGPKDSGELCLAEHSWEFGFYEVRVKARDHFWLESDWKVIHIATDILEISPWIEEVLQLDLLPYVNTLGGGLDTKLDGAIGHIVSSLDQGLWTDSAHLDPQHGHRVFAEHKSAVKKLQELMGHKGVPDSMLNAGRRAVGMLALMDGLLADAAVEDAIAGGVEGKKAVHQLSLALGGVDAGHDDMLAGDYDSSIDSNRAAWGHAQMAMG